MATRFNNLSIYRARNGLFCDVAGERLGPFDDRLEAEAAVDEYVEEKMLRADKIFQLRKAGCDCNPQLIGWKRGIGPFCRLCSITATVLDFNP